MQLEVRVLSLNVHAWQDRWRRSNTRRVAALLRQLRPHILCLQEVHARPRWFADDFGAEGEEDPKGTDLSLFQSLLALPLEGETLTEDGWPWEWAWLSLAEAGGSAVASRLPVTHRHLHRLPTPDRPLVGLRVETGGPLGAVDIFSVHLDHLHESRRTAQIESLVAYLDEAGCGPLRALLGDFNALSREDYDDGEWARIGVRRQGARLDPPSAEATELLRRLGYTDIRHTATATATAHDHNDESDARNKVDETEAGDDDDDGDDDDEDEDDEDDEEVVHTEGWTCWAGTRVDYAWLSNDLQRAVVDAQLRVVPDLTVSDHRPLLLSLRLPSSPSSS